MVKILLAIAAAAAALCCVPIASADDQYNGQTYAEVAKTLSAKGITSKIGAAVGDALPTAQCVVTESRTVPMFSASGATGANEVVLELNCNRTAATAGQPQQSAQSGSGSQTGG